MKDINSEFVLLERFVKGLGSHFGSQCEFVLHDYSKGFEHSIVSISNGQVSGRKIGDAGTAVGLRVYEGEADGEGKCNDLIQTKDGRILRSSTMYITNDDNKVIGSLCVNLDVTELIRTRNYLEEMINYPELKPVPIDEVQFGDVDSMLHQLIRESIREVGVPVALMTRDQKIEGVKYLQKRGAFKIKNAGNMVAAQYDVSKFTIYNYLNELEEPGEEEK